MKKKRFVLFFIFTVSLSLFFSSCSPYTYEGKDVSSIKYLTVDYNGGYTEESIIDFIDCQVLSRNFLPLDSYIEDYALLYEFESGAIPLFLNEVGEAGLFDLQDHYLSPAGIIHGGGWTLTIDYVDGSSKTSSGDNNAPSSVFKKADYAFYNLYGDDLFGSLPSSYTNPPVIDIAFSYSIGTNSYSQGYNGGLSPINYTWHKLKVSDIDVFTYAIQNPIHDFDTSISYKFVLWTANYDHKFSKMIITSYDLNGNDSKDVDNSGWFKQKEYNLEFNRIYVINMTFDYGTCEYVFSTVV